jgi:hypothetical protein
MLTQTAPNTTAAAEDIGNIVSLEHVNVRIDDQSRATLFYIIGLGFTRDPYMNVGLTNMWINIGDQQFHLPTGKPQVLRGHTGLVVPDLAALKERLGSIEGQLGGTQFAWSDRGDYVEASSPWGNVYRAYAPGSYGAMRLGVPYVEFTAPRPTSRWAPDRRWCSARPTLCPTMTGTTSRSISPTSPDRSSTSRSATW